MGPVGTVDREDVLFLWNQEKRWLGNGGLTWKRYVQEVSGNSGASEYWIKALWFPGDGIAPILIGFAHYRVRKDGWRALYEIAVDSRMRGKGVGKLLLSYVSVPVRLKTDHDNAVSNAFYQRLGFRRVGQVRSKNQQRTLNVYERDE